MFEKQLGKKKLQTMLRGFEVVVVVVVVVVVLLFVYSQILFFRKLFMIECYSSGLGDGASQSRN